MFERFATLLALHIKSDYDFVLETYKRLNLVLFLVETFKVMKYPPFS